MKLRLLGQCSSQSANRIDLRALDSCDADFSHEGIEPIDNSHTTYILYEINAVGSLDEFVHPAFATGFRPTATELLGQRVAQQA